MICIFRDSSLYRKILSCFLLLWDLLASAFDSIFPTKLSKVLIVWQFLSD